jgi:hypothetical protein
LLTLLGAAREQDDQHVAIPPQIDAVARPKINPVFKNPVPDRLDVREIPLLDPR